jgi:uncharacterized membrane protein YdjX (TVP38/TMEM64 family)
VLILKGFFAHENYPGWLPKKVSILPNRRLISQRHMTAEDTKSKRGRQGLWRPVALILAIIIVFIAARLLGLGERLGELREWVESLGAWGPVVFMLIYIGAVVAALPGSALTIACGAIFGSALGVVLVSISATIGASLSFLIARYFARDAVANRLLTKEKFRRLDRLTEERGAVVVALTRLVPLFPFNLLNYGFGLTRVRFWTYVFWSWLCMLPGTILYVVGADAVVDALTRRRAPWALIAVLVAVMAVLAFLVRFARRRLQVEEKMREEPPEKEDKK